MEPNNIFPPYDRVDGDSTDSLNLTLVYLLIICGGMKIEIVGSTNLCLGDP